MHRQGLPSPQPRGVWPSMHIYPLGPGRTSAEASPTTGPHEEPQPGPWQLTPASLQGPRLSPPPGAAGPGCRAPSPVPPRYRSQFLRAKDPQAGAGRGPCGPTSPFFTAATAPWSCASNLQRMDGDDAPARPGGSGQRRRPPGTLLRVSRPNPVPRRFRRRSRGRKV